MLRPALDQLRRHWKDLLSEKLREAGCDDAEIGSITGMSLTTIRRCLRFADQKRLAKSAQRRLEQHANAEKL
jgi:transcription initiation factor IIE alpha subunit